MSARLAKIRRTWRSLRFKHADPYRRADLLRERGARVGAGCRIHTTSVGSEPYLISIGDETLIGPSVTFITHDAGTWVFRKEHPRTGRFGRITIGSRVFVGAHAILLPGITIGDKAIVAAGAVVSRDVAAGTVVAGVPARVVSTVERYLKKTLDEYPLLDAAPSGRPRTVAELRRLLEERYPLK